MPKGSLAVPENITSSIRLIRGHRVMLDADLASLYGVDVRALNQAVQRNADRFPDDFMFQLNREEVQALTMENSAVKSNSNILRSQIVTSSWGGRRYRPYAFTEQGVAMLSSVLRSQQAVQVNIEIMRTFVQLRRMLASNVELSRKLAALERKYDAQFKVVFDAIRELMTPPQPKRRPIGFTSWPKDD